MSKSQKRYSEGFKQAAVEKVFSGASAYQVAKECGARARSIRDWVEAARQSSGSGPLTAAEKDEVRRLKREIRQLREDNEILKKATALYAAERR